MSQKRKIRISSWLLALIYLIYGYCLFVVMHKFGNIAQEMHITLPALSNQVFSIPSSVWLIGSIIIAVLLIIRDMSGKTTLFPDRVAYLILVISAVIAFFALYLAFYIFPIDKL